MESSRPSGGLFGPDPVGHRDLALRGPNPYSPESRADSPTPNKFPTAPSEILVHIQGEAPEGRDESHAFKTTISLNSLANMFNRASSTKVREHANYLATSHSLRKSIFNEKGDVFTITMRRVFKIPKERGMGRFFYPECEDVTITGIGPTEGLKLPDTRRLQVKPYGRQHWDYALVTLVYDDYNVALIDDNHHIIYLRREDVNSLFPPNYIPKPYADLGYRFAHDSWCSRKRMRATATNNYSSLAVANAPTTKLLLLRNFNCILAYILPPLTIFFHQIV